VYGRVKAVGGGGRQGASAQHFGIGKSLLAIAEEISTKYGYKQIAIISGIGVRDYYRKRGYELRGTYMMKNILGPMADIWCLDIAIIMVFLAITSLSAYLMVL
jgi:hypothetical protein